MPEQKFFGKYRGVVLNNIDPMRIGRIMVQVPDVSGMLPSSWAMPCVPVAGIQQGFFTLPAVGSGVWVEFEHGDADYPVWVGGYWGSAAEVPTLANTLPPGTTGFVIQTQLQSAIVVSDLPGPTGGIMLKSATGAAIIVNDTGIYIQNGKGAVITLIGPATDVNSGALTAL